MVVSASGTIRRSSVRRIARLTRRGIRGAVSKTASSRFSSASPSRSDAVGLVALIFVDVRKLSIYLLFSMRREPEERWKRHPACVGLSAAPACKLEAHFLIGKTGLSVAITARAPLRAIRPACAAFSPWRCPVNAHPSVVQILAFGDHDQFSPQMAIPAAFRCDLSCI